MPLNLSVPTVTELKPRICVIGVGGAGGNAVNNMIESQLEGVEFVVANTDAQAVGLALAEHKIQLGTGVTKGLGAGSQPQIGKAAAEESLADVMELINGANMLFITAGMGGGTGTGAAPVIAKAAREQGILTVGVVTKPFHFEGARRMRIAEEGIAELQKHVDTLLIIPNQNLFRVADDNTTFADAFAMADEVLHSGVRGITDLMIVPGLINLDFADVRTVMSEMGKAMMGTGEAEGDKRAAEAAEAAISNPLLDEVSMKGAKGVLINITGGLDMKLFEVDEAANRIRSEVDPDANIIVGSTFSSELEGKMRVSVVATGIDAAERQKAEEAKAQEAAAQNARAEAKPWLGNIAPAKPAAEAAVEISDDEDDSLFASASAGETDPAPRAAVQAPQLRKPSAPIQRPAARTEPKDILKTPEGNRVRDVHSRIIEMLTEDEGRAHSGQGPARQRPNPFHEQTKRPIHGALNLLKETFGGQHEQPPRSRKSVQSERAQPPRREREAKDLFQEDDDSDLEIPAFLRRNGSE
ncbi:cell division protein FtsZ [Aquisalinus flavus]|uniref:Cell division protein FtsZ n=1 Tax=Aquisalinus flavus TaxID=1526572 RepID=A0A8J2V296_9PROT|nr:cell division protein FtsZ [Aquisalinus flavus]MBD0427302.1 cell division protein FtsZ [Aquisalinus flavus]UNE47110.1 cell division protein FtsZ [Aquisalinus flavus]GGC99906.1 cell division protein FtsZ [Aquisalinus flavus]